MNEDNDKLMQAAGSLTTEIAPERDLWGGIERDIRRPRQAPWAGVFAQAATVLLLVGASSVVTYFVVRQEPGMIEVAPPALEAEFVSLAGPAELGERYGQARGDLLASLNRELARLSPETREDVERNLAVIRQAITDINAALEQEPDNQLLQELLVAAYREEFVIMQRIGTVTSRVMARQDI